MIGYWEEARGACLGGAVQAGSDPSRASSEQPIKSFLSARTPVGMDSE